MEENGLGWSGWIGVAGGVAGVVSAIVALLAWLGPSRREVQDDLASDAAYRADIAASLRDGSLGQRYRNGLEGGLALLDRQFGAPCSAKALGLCIIIALVYAYAGFFLVWGLGGPGVIGGLEVYWATEQPGRLILAAVLAILPLIGYLLGRALGPRIRSFERRLVTRLQMTLLIRRRWRWRRNVVDRIYRLASAIALLIALMLQAAIPWNFGSYFIVFTVMFAALPILGVAAAVHFRSRFRSDWAGALVSTTAGAAVVPAAFAFISMPFVVVATAIAKAFALDFYSFHRLVTHAAVLSAAAGAAVGAVAIAVVVGTVVLVAVAAAFLHLLVFIDFMSITQLFIGLNYEYGSANIRFHAFMLTFSSTFAAGLCPKPGSINGAIGVVLGIASIFAFINQGLLEKMVVVLLVFFFILPLINGGVDWASWWVTRRLGAHLLGAFDRGVGAVRLALVALGHGIFDLAIAAGMLLGMAFMLALGFEAYNQASLLQGDGAFDLEVYVAGAAAAPFGEGAWLTLMLLTTLLPTFLHVAVVWMSPLGFVFLSTRRRQWADDLQRWDDLDDAARSRTRRAVVSYVAHGRIGLWLLAGLLSVGLFALMAGAVAMVHQGGFASYVAEAAYRGIETARWLGGF